MVQGTEQLAQWLIHIDFTFKILEVRESRVSFEELRRKTSWNYKHCTRYPVKLFFKEEEEKDIAMLQNEKVPPDPHWNKS